MGNAKFAKVKNKSRRIQKLFNAKNVMDRELNKNLLMKLL